MRAHYLVLLVASACADGGFAPLPDDAKGTRVIGRVLALDGAAVEGAQVFAVQDGVGIASARTDATGDYTIDDVVAGPLEVFAHAGADGGALDEVVVYGGGDNRAPDLYVGPFGEYPRLVDYRDIDFEERITSARSDLNVLRPRLVRGWPAPDTRLQLFRLEGRTRTMVEIDFETGEETALFEADLLQPVAGGRLLLDRHEDQMGWFVRDGASREILAAIESGGDFPWIVLDDRTVVFMDHLRLVVVRPDGTAREKPNIVTRVSSGMVYLGRYGEHLFFRSTNTLSYVVRVDLATLEVEPWAEVFGVVEHAGHHIDAEAGVLHLLQESSPQGYVRVTIDLETKTIRESEALRAERGTPAQFLGKQLVELRAGESQLFRFEPDGQVTGPIARGNPWLDPRAEGYMIGFDPTEVTIVDIDSAEVRRVPFADLAVDPPVCAELSRCGAIKIDGHPALIERGPDDDPSATRIVELPDNGQPIVHEIDGYDDFLGVTYGDGLNAVTGFDPAGAAQAFVFATGTPSLTQATFLDSRHRTMLGFRGRRLYYLARDPISGNTQLFGRTL